MEVVTGDFSNRNTDGFKTSDPYVWCDRFTVKNTDGIIEGFEIADPYGWHDRFTVKNTDGITEGFEKQVHAVTCLFSRQNYRQSRWRCYSVDEAIGKSEYMATLRRPSPPPFLLLLPNPNSPHLQITSPPSPPNKNLAHLSTTSCISWSFVVTTSVFWFTDGFYQFL